MTTTTDALRDTLDAIYETEDPKARMESLVSLLVSIVDEETLGGSLTNNDDCLEGQDWWYPLDDALRKALFKRIGNGHFSIAYSHPMLPNRVIKVGFRKEDSGAAYIAFCRMHQGKAGIPNIYDVQRHESCYTVVLDALIEADIYDNDEHNKYTKLAQGLIERSERDSRAYQPASTASDFDKEFAETCLSIREFFKGIAIFDMHEGNIMFDEFDTPYITDPVSFTKGNSESPLSVDPDELLAEIEQIAKDAAIKKAIAKHKRKADRLVHARNRRKMRKMAGKFRKNRTAMRAKAHINHRQKMRDEAHARLFMGSDHLRAAWLMAGHNLTLRFEEQKANMKKVHDHLAIQAGGDLWIDKKFDMMFQCH